MSLSTGSVQLLYEDRQVQNALVQVLEVKKVVMPNPEDGERYRIILSDGQKFIQAMLSADFNDLANKGLIKRYSIIKLKEFVCNNVRGRRILIVLDCDVVQPDVTGTIGDPQSVEASAKVSGNQQLPQPQRNPSGFPQQQQSYNYPPQYQQPQSFQSGQNQPHFQQQQRGHNFPDAYQRAPPQSNGTEKKILPISDIHMYLPAGWWVKGRVVKKSPVKTWTNNRGSGKLFSIELVDQKGEIKCTFFNSGVDRFHDMIQEDKVYLISRGTIKDANRKFNTLNSDYEINLDENSIVEECNEDEKIPHMQFNFVLISDLERVKAEEQVDVIGVLVNVSDITQITTRNTDRQISKRNITLLDGSKKTVEATLWGEQAQNFSGNIGSVVAVKSARVSDFNGRTLNVSSMSSFYVDPELTEAFNLSGWYKREGSGISASSLTSQGPASNPVSRRKNLAAIELEGLGKKEKPDYISTRATLVFIRHDKPMWYIAKQVDHGSEQPRYEKCDETDPEARKRYSVSTSFSDYSGSQWATAFDEYGKMIMGGKSAEEVADMKEANPAAYELFIQDQYFKQYIVKLRVKYSTFNGEERLRCIVQSLTPVDFIQESRNLISEILSSK